MDRYDEKKDVRNSDETARGGDVLGLSGSEVPKAPGDPGASNDPEAVRHRRERALGGDETGVHPEDGDRQRSGATGIDMGAGGQGTHIKGD